MKLLAAMNVTHPFFGFPVIVLGIDPGSKVAGFGVLECPDAGFNWRQLVVKDAGAIKVAASQSPASKLCQVADAVKSLVHSHKADCVVLESAFFGVNARSALKLGEVRGAVVAQLAAEPVALFEVTPSFVKKQVTGNGHAGKADVKAAVCNLLKIQLGASPYDVSDALAIALAFSLSCRGRPTSKGGQTWQVDAGVQPLSAP